MVITCPNCQGGLTVEESMAGRQAKCSYCGCVFKVSLPTQAVSAPPPPVPAPQTIGIRERTASGPIACAVALGGVVLLVVAFVLPWWSITGTIPEQKKSSSGYDRYSSYSPGRDVERDMERAMEKEAPMLVKNAGWYVAHSNIADFDKVKAFGVSAFGKGEGGTLTLRAWGWHCGAGIAILVLGVVAAAVLCSMLASGFLRRRAWAGLLVTALMGIAALVLALVWIISCPGENIEPYLTQGVHVGPFVALAGGAVLTVCGLVGGIIGLNRLAKKSAAAARAQAAAA